MLPGLFPELVSPHALAEQLVRDSRNGNRGLCDLGVGEGFGVLLEVCRRILKQKQDALHAPRQDVQVNIPKGVAFVGLDFSVG